MGEGIGKDRRKAVVCAVAILREEKGILIWGIHVERCSKLTCYVLDISLVFN